MGEIARAAGVSKGTLYVYFADKCRLFEAIVEEEALERRQLAFYFDPACDIKTTLRKFGEAYIGMLCRPGGGSAARMVFAIAERMPEVGRRYYELVLQKTVNRLAEYLDARVKQRPRAMPVSILYTHPTAPLLFFSLVTSPLRIINGDAILARTAPPFPPAARLILRACTPLVAGFKFPARIAAAAAGPRNSVSMRCAS